MKIETKVGLLFLSAIVVMVGFAYFLGLINPFSSDNELKLAYNFAGGIELGSPVRVMGIKVGKVKSIDFIPEQKMPSGEEVKLRITISVSKKAWPTIRKDSKFYINLAGVIGEKFIEITPGSLEAELLKEGELLRGEDPPRIDQLISQSYGLAGKILEMVEENETSVVDTITTMSQLVTNLNSALKHLNKITDKKDVSKLIANMVTLTDNMSYFSEQMRTEDGKKTLKLINDLLFRLEGLDKAAIKKFLQDEGIKAKLF